ncbi:ABC transporter ATP-binding protein/permease [Candidatus Pelagibacter ubique]|nr:ABC transporter ATP-binding protein/permease [Candidatus Pelagibacter ubique]
MFLKPQKIFGVENNQQFLFILGIFVFILLVVSQVFKVITTYFQVRFIQMREYSIGKRLIEGYLHQPYSWFLNRHSAELGKSILSEVAIVIGGCIYPVMELISKGMVTIALIVLLVLVDPKIALIVGLSISFTYGVIFFFLRSYLKQIGKERLKNNQSRFMSVSEAFGAAKEIKVGGLEQIYITRFSDAAKNFARYTALSQTISQLPRFILEAIAFGGVMLMILYMMRQTGGFINSLPIISLYIFAGYRLMPAVQQIYTAFTQISFNSPSIDLLNKDIKNLKPFNSNQAHDVDALSLNKAITLKNIYYNYPNTTRTALKNININIPAKSTVGLIGTTGSGKTTTVDIILGLLEPQKGTLEVDGQVVSKQNSRAWQRSIGYVPQHIFLTDETIEANIAFGSDPKDINQEAVEKASKIANLHEFIMHELPNKYQTTIGERGVRLSGGQRQRIGIARALYHNPQVLILDEATSALDNQTEQAVMDAVNNITKDITIILIAHRLNTVKNCDIIFKLEKGQIIKQEAAE